MVGVPLTSSSTITQVLDSSLRTVICMDTGACPSNFPSDTLQESWSLIICPLCELQRPLIGMRSILSFWVTSQDNHGFCKLISSRAVKEGREERIFLWFDPTKAYHTYSVLWNDHQIVWYVDSKPIRVYRNTPVTSATYPKLKAMTLYSSIWNGDDWATRGGLDKINWAFAPFTASYSNFNIDACPWNQPSSAPRMRVQ
ncbi:hypothetical protein KP509_1Z250500 [Ceratopteris richardii]|nr:hypothetical protein KP509_1Z250500 [Ceratopteris richardii]